MSRDVSLVQACPQCGRVSGDPCRRHGPDQRPVLLEADDAEELRQAFADGELYRRPED